MHVLYLHQYFVTPAESGGTRSYEMARRLVRRGHRVTLLTSSAFLGDRYAPTPGWHTHEIEGVEVHVLRLPYSNRMGYPARIRAFAEFAARTTRRAIRASPDVVFATSTPLTIAIPGAAAAGVRRIPMVFEVRDLWPEVPIAVGALRNPAVIAAARALERFAYRASARIVALSPGMKAGIVSTGYPQDLVTVIPNSCDLELFDVPEDHGRAFRAARPWLEQRPLVVYAGTIGRANNVTYLVELAARARALAPDLRFLVVGDGMEEPLVRERAQALGVLDQNFRMERPIPKRDVPALLSAATVATSVFAADARMADNSANKFFDALAAGRPLAINYGGWQEEILRDTGAGIALSPTDLDAAARELASFTADPARLGRARTAARELARTRFDRDSLAAALEGVLTRAAAGVPARRQAR